MSFIISFRGWSKDRSLRPTIDEFMTTANELNTMKNLRHIPPPIERNGGKPIDVFLSTPGSVRLKYKKEEIEALFESQGLLDSKVLIFY